MSFGGAFLGIFRLNSYFDKFYVFDYLSRLFKMKRGSLIVISRGGFKFEVKTISDYLLIMDMLNDSYGKIPGGGIVIDIGAHKGIFSVLSSRMAKRVYSFEPSTSNFNVLEKNIKINGIKNIQAIHSAVGGKDGKLRLYLSDSALGHSVYKKTNK